ncbi:MAG: cupin domain-containing protein [Candidatus Latescibacteria bacterium]|nr:cupin domain-containing protein [Candidatus Latescibacterota bacterium]
MDKRHWIDCPATLTHGNIIQRVIFTRQDPQARQEGGVLRFIESFARAYLEPGVSSVPHVNEGIQEVFFVASGSGQLVAGAQKHGLREGDGVIMPPGVEHTFVNEGQEPLELLILVEAVPKGAKVKGRKPLVRNFAQNNMGQGHWSHLVHKVFDRNDGLLQMHAVLIVRIEAMQPADTHGHGADMDEVWYMWKGQGIHVVSQEVCVQTPGTAVSVCPSNPGHSLINHTCQPLQVFYFARYPQ